MSQDLILRIKVIPKSSRTEMAGEMADGTLKVRVAAPPEKGKANAELCAFLAKHYGVPRGRVAILSGETSPLKHVRIKR
ncbi:MAG: YggU family protein [Bryobacterales bacterium]|nr:YggU family protein [Bryobacterales bacterium]